MGKRSDPARNCQERTIISYIPDILLYKYQYMPIKGPFFLILFRLVSTYFNTLKQNNHALKLIPLSPRSNIYPFVSHLAPSQTTQTTNSSLQKHYKNYLYNKAMLNPSTSQAASQEQVYGFLCQRTNVFYAFESLQACQEFLLWLERENSDTDQTGMQPEEKESFPLPNEAQQLVDFQMATDEIMSVFEDLAFKERPTQIQLEEVDF